MPKPTIVATGSTTPANSPGISKAYVQGETLTFSDPANPSPSTRLLEYVSGPSGQTSTIVGPTTANPTLLLDVDANNYGTHRVRWTADGEIGELLFSIETTGAVVMRIPNYLEQHDEGAGPREATWNKDGNTKGWFLAHEQGVLAQNAAIDQNAADAAANASSIVTNTSNIATNTAAISNHGARITSLETHGLESIFTSGSRLITGAIPASGVLSIPHTLGAAFQGLFGVSGHRFRILPDAQQTNKATQIDIVVEMWELIERKVVSGSAATSVLFNTDIDGDLDGAHRILGGWVDPLNLAAQTLVLRPNSSSADAVISRTYGLNGAASAGGTAPNLSLAFTSGGWASNAPLFFDACLWHVIGNTRSAFSSRFGGGREDASTHSLGGVTGGIWDSAVQVTSLEIIAATNGIGLDSWFEVYRMIPRGAFKGIVF